MPEAINSLRVAGIKVWVLTGDKQETAINIGYSSKLFELEMDIMIINATSLVRLPASPTFSLPLSLFSPSPSPSSSFSLPPSLPPYLSLPPSLPPTQQEECRELLEARCCEMNAQGSTGLGTDSREDSVDSILSRSMLMRPVTAFAHRKRARGHQVIPNKALVIDGATLEFALQPSLRKLFVSVACRCKSVICCRASPQQKVGLLSHVQDEHQLCTIHLHVHSMCSIQLYMM